MLAVGISIGVALGRRRPVKRWYLPPLIALCSFGLVWLVPLDVAWVRRCAYLVWVAGMMGIAVAIYRLRRRQLAAVATQIAGAGFFVGLVALVNVAIAGLLGLRLLPSWGGLIVGIIHVNGMHDEAISYPFGLVILPFLLPPLGFVLAYAYAYSSAVAANTPRDLRKSA